MTEATQIILTLATVLTSAGAWQFYQTRLKTRAKQAQSDKSEQTMFRDDLRERVAKLELQVQEANEDKEKLRTELSDALQTLASYKVRLEFLEKENERLKQR